MKTLYAVAGLTMITGAAACSGASGTPPSGEEPSPAGLVLGPQPSFGPVVQRPEPPPPISGGTLAMARGRDRTVAVASDADRDRIYVVEVAARAVLFTIQLPPRSEPGRVAIDDSGHAYVALRRAGGVAVVDLASGEHTVRAACLTPRGVAFDPKLAVVHVACASGELMKLPVAGGPPGLSNVAPDLRDVVVTPHGGVFVTTFRSARSFNIMDGAPLPLATSSDTNNVAWRSVAMPPTSESCIEDVDGGAGKTPQPGCEDEMAVVHQRPVGEQVDTSPGGYGGGSSEPQACGRSGIVSTHVSIGSGSVVLPEAVLPVDLATNGRELAVVAAGNAFTPSLAQIFVVAASDARSSRPCAPMVRGQVSGQAIAAVFDHEDALVVQTREPATLTIMTDDRKRPWKVIPLANDSVADTGHAIFHANAGGGIACGSCHPEGSDDGHVWDFTKIGPRRTPSLLGTVVGTEPFHWDGDMRDLRDIVDHVFVERMSGPKVDADQLGALSKWMFALPPPTKLRAESEITARGSELFTQRCASCHEGRRLTNNRTVDVGTGGAFQVPSLVGIGWRAPFLHTGCAPTLADRFRPECGGATHGTTQDLNGNQVSELVQFLETL